MTTYDSSQFPITNDLLSRYREAYGGTGTFPNQYTYSRDQFHGLTDYEPYPIERRSVDNPPFLWPSNQYMDSAGNTGKIQRGYMRSLISDPQVDTTKTMRNRRLFFQFNPQVLVRSVQQSVGSMMPLLQDPAQLTQPVPGTTSFGFELMFNREHEVNAGYSDGNTEWLMLPSGQKALVSEIGVLADLMILDTITGQGLSQDMINSLVNTAKRQYQNINEANKKTLEEMKEAGIEQETLDYQPLEVPGDTDLQEIFDNNLGNSAFLNPLPFRVLFSSLFMVEGVATSVDVVFQKFSRTMVPTQCKVTISMYALYLGFAKEKTFIFDNLKQSAQEGQEIALTDKEVETALYDAITSSDGRLLSQKGGSDWPSDANPSFEVIDIRTSDRFQEYLEKNEVTEANFSFALEYFFSPTDSVSVSYETLKNSNTPLLQDGKKADFNAKGTKKVKGLRALIDGQSIFKAQMPKEPGGSILNPYLTFRIITYVHAKSSTGNIVTFPMAGTVVRNLSWYSLVGYSPLSSYRHTPQYTGSDSRAGSER